jgi:hypothetical protein
MTGKARRPARSRPPLPAEPSLPKGERVYLRVLVKADAAAFVAAARGRRRLHRSRVHPPATTPEFARRMQRKRDDSQRIALVALRREHKKGP